MGAKSALPPKLQPEPSIAFKSPLKDNYTTASKDMSGLGPLRGSSHFGLSQSGSVRPASPQAEQIRSPLTLPKQPESPSLRSREKAVTSWSASLTQHLSSQPAMTGKSAIDPSKGDANKNSGDTSVLKTSALKAAKTALKREVLSPEMSYQYCNVDANLDMYVENVRRWFMRKILIPLSDQIKQVDGAFESAGLSHLSCRFPATYSLAAKSHDADRARSPFFISSSIGIGDGGKIQTLMDLVQSRPNDPMVKMRLLLERYLNLATITSHRVTLIKRISSFAEGSFVRIPSGAISVPELEDSHVLLHLFCTFMDSNLPSENANDPQPFTSTYFIPADEKASLRQDAIQIQQLSTSPFTLQLIAEDKTLTALPGYNNIFEVILFMVDVVHRKRKGYLGIGNLASSNIDLMSVLSKNN